MSDREKFLSICALEGFSSKPLRLYKYASPTPQQIFFFSLFFSLYKKPFTMLM